MDAKELAVYYKHNGKNCAQAVMLALKEKVDLSEEELLKIGAGFGQGMGSLEATCGALIGANILIGLKKGPSVSVASESKAMLNEFQDHCGATICKVLKGIETKKVLCTCDDCIRCAVNICLKRLE